MPFRRADAWSDITDGITVPPLPVKPSDEASGQIEASVTKGRARRTARPPTSPKKPRARPKFLDDPAGSASASPRGAAPGPGDGESTLGWLIVPALLVAAAAVVATLRPDLLPGVHIMLKVDQ